MLKKFLPLSIEYGFDDAQFSVTEEGHSALVLFTKYAPDSSIPELGKIRLSNYYVVAQQGYINAKRLIAQLAELGHTCKLFHKNGMKQIAAKACGAIGRNTLFYHPQFASYNHIQVLTLDFSISPHIHYPTNDFCGSCTKCRDVCPTHAISMDGFDSNLCIRAHTNQPTIPSEYGMHIYQLMGCERCQLICPKNPAPSNASPTFDLLELLEGLHTANIKKIIGTNYGTRTRLLNQALFYAANTGYTPALPIVESLLKDSQCGMAAEYAYGILKK